MKRTASEFDWHRCYEHRTERLAALIKMQAPKAIIELECRMVLKAITRSGLIGAIKAWLKDGFRDWRDLKRFALEQFWYRRIQGCSGCNDKQVEEKLSGPLEIEEDMAIKELQRMFDLGGK